MYGEYNNSVRTSISIEPFSTLFDHRDPSLFPSIADLRCSDKARAIMDAALVAPAAAITRKTAGKWATGINEFYRFEHKMKDDASDKAFENVTPLEPNHPFIRLVIYLA